MRLFREPYLLLIIAVIFINSTTILAQDYPNCLLDGDLNEQIIIGIGAVGLCDDNTFEDFAAMTKEDLLNYLIAVDDYDCFGRKIFYYRQNISEELFTDDKIDHLTNEATILANNFNGINNGIFGLLHYFKAAISQNFDYGLFISDSSWQKITTVCSTLSSNGSIINSVTNDANMISGHLFATCWANNMPGQTPIINLVQQTLNQHAELQNWQNFVNTNEEYGYYFKITYLLGTFLFYAIRDSKDRQSPKFYNRLNENPYQQIIASLAYAACDPDLRNLNIPRISESSFLSAKALKILGEVAKNDDSTLYQNHLEQALLQVLNCYNYLEPVWVYAAEALINNETDIGYANETVRTDLLNQEFPNQHIFEDGKLIMHSQLTDIEVLGLYEALQQVKAQFFRLFELTEQMPVEDDPNETVQIRIYKNRDAYRFYNGFLFGAPSPGGGVFIEDANTLNEDYATIYTWDREANESSYTLEELVRHEYVHYLQARYLIKGMWGQRANPFYEEGRLIWFEEGMAEFFSGCTATEGIIDKDVIKNHTKITPSITLQEATRSGYSTNTYNFGSIIWSNWHKTNRQRFKDLSNFTRLGTNYINDFDNYLANAITNDDQNFQGHINCLKQDICESWSPLTVGMDYSQFSTSDINSLNLEFIFNIDNIGSTQIEKQYQSQMGRFHLSGSYTVDAGNSDEETKINLYDRLDEILVEMKNNSNHNNFNYATAYYSNLNISSNPPTAQFHLVGPLKKESHGVYPGDVNYDGVVNALDIMHIGHYLSESNGMPNNNSPDISWQYHQRDDWNTNQTAIYCYYGFEDLKQADCNGDGTIDTTDLVAIQQNWHNTHLDAPLFQPVLPCFYFDDFSDYQLLLQPVGVLNNNNIVINVVLDRISNEPVSLLSGFININYSDNINTTVIDFNDSWLGTPAVDFKHLSNENTTDNKLETGFIKTNLTNSVGSGVVAQIIVELEPNNASNIELYVEFGFQNNETDNFFFNNNIEIFPNYAIQGIGNSICYDDLNIHSTTSFQNQYNSSGTIETNGKLSVGKNQVIEYNGDRVRLNTGFSVKAGAYFKVAHQPCQ